MMKRSLKDRIKKLTLKYKKYFPIMIVAILGICSGAGIDFAIRPTETGEIIIESSFSLHLSDQQTEAVVETSEGEDEVIDNVVTVEEVSGNQLVSECPENEEECGQGRYIYAPTATFTEFKDYTLGGCWDVDSAYSAQCWDLAALFWMNYTDNGRTLSTCGTGAAKGAWNCKEQNAGTEFDLIYDATSLQAGDWIIFSSGQYGHVGMAMGSYNNGYITLLGQNQGGTPCSGGGAAANIINISLKSFVGAFRPKTYEKPEPTPTPLPISGCIDWHVLRGDTMSKIMLECEGTVVYGEPMNQYADSWISQIYNKGHSVYYGWTHGNGYGLYADDYLLHEIGE